MNHSIFCHQKALLTVYFLFSRFVYTTRKNVKFIIVIQIKRMGCNDSIDVQCVFGLIAFVALLNITSMAFVYSVNG